MVNKFTSTAPFRNTLEVAQSILSNVINVNKKAYRETR